MYTYPDAIIWSAAQVISEDDTLTHLPLPRASCIEGVKNALNRLIAAKIVGPFVHAGHVSCTLTRYAVSLVNPTAGWRFRYGPVSGPYLKRYRRPRSAITGREQVQQIASYSITSSARASSVTGISMPIVLAVFALITSSNFVGRSICKSAGFAPLNILSTNVAAREYSSA